MHPEKKFNDSVLGTGFWFLGEWVHSSVDIRKDESDRFDSMLDVMSKTFLGVTVACARCHDHKFDAISTADHYSLSGFLQSSDYRQVRFETMEKNRLVAEQLVRVDNKYQGEIFELLESQDIKLPAVKVARFGAAVNDLVWNGLQSVTEGSVQNRSAISKLPNSGRTLRSPTFDLNHGRVSCWIDGSGHIVACVDSHRLVAGPLHKQTIRKVKSGERWVTLDMTRTAS